MTTKSNLQLYFKELIKSEQFSSLAQRKPDYVCDLFVYEPMNIEEAHLGTLFMLGKIEHIPKNKYRNFDFLLNLLISVIKREFYSNYKRPTSEALEASLNKANLYLADFTEKGNIEWIGNFSFICGAFSKNNLYITQVGTSIIKLFRGTSINNIDNKFPTPKKFHPLKTFGNIASGTLIDGDKVFLSFKDALNIVPIVNLKNIAKGNCNQIIDEIKKIIEKRLDKSPMLCLVLEFKKRNAEEIVVYSSKFARPERPIQEIKNSIYGPKKNKIKLVILKFIKVSKKLFHLLKTLLKFLYPLVIIIKRIFKKIYRVHLIHKLGTNLCKILAPVLLAVKKIFLKIKSKVKDKITNFKIKDFYHRNKPAFFIASLLIILILTLPFFIAQKINYHIKTNDFKKSSTEIDEILKKTDEALVYSEIEKARGLIRKNQNLLADLSNYLHNSSLNNDAEIINTFFALQNKYQNQVDSVNNVKRIDNLEEIFDFSKSGFIINPVGITKIENTLYFYEYESGIIYKLGLDTEKKDLVLIFISAKDELRKFFSLENNVVIFGQSGKVYVYDSKTNDYKTYSFDPTIATENIGSAKGFLSNMYILDNKIGNIIKYSFPTKNTEGVIGGINWLAAPQDELKQGISITTDGAIYILYSNGLIAKYFEGKKVSEIKSQLENQINENSKIFTGADFKNLYVSDPKNKRIVVLDKHGQLINQYINDEFSNISDFFVDNGEKEIYLLCGEKVLKLEI